MRNKLLIAAGLVACFVGGMIFNGYSGWGAAKAPNPQAGSATPLERVAYSPTRSAVYAPQPVQPVVQRQVIYQQAPRTQKRRSWERGVLIVAGSTGAGAAIGAAAGGGKGARIGAVSGAVAGLVYDLATRDKQ